MTTAMTDIVLTAASVEVAAGETTRPSITIVAYTGGIMRVGGWGDLCIDLAGLDCGGAIPLLVDHDPALDQIVGKGQASVQANQLHVAGIIVGSTDAARKVLDLAKDGFPLQASVGVSPEETIRVYAGETIHINGQQLTAPRAGLTVVRKGKLREVSVVTLGCDSNTSVSIAASKGNLNDDDGDMLAAERSRVASIMKITAQHPQIAAKAIADGWDSTRAELEVLRASRPTAPMAGGYRAVATHEVIEAAFAFRMGLGKVAERHFKPDVLEQAHNLGVTHMLDLCRMALTLEGHDIPLSRDAMVKAALTTFSLPAALGDLASKSLLDAYNDALSPWRSFAAVRSVPDFRTHTAIRPSFTGNLEQVAPGGELKHGGMNEWTTQYRIDTYGKILSIDRRDLVNDDLSVFADASSAMGRAAMRKLNDLVIQVLLASANAFFSSANGNLISGVATALGCDSLANAITLMRTQKDEEGNDLDLKPACLLVPPELEPTARALIISEYIQRAVDTPTGNSLKAAVTVEVEPRLANSQKFGNAASDKHWYLFASSAAAPMVVAFLNGQQSPTLEYQGIESNINTLAASWRVYHDFSAALVDPRGRFVPRAKRKHHQSNHGRQIPSAGSAAQKQPFTT